MIIRNAIPVDAAPMLQLFKETVRAVNSRDYAPAQIAAWAHEGLTVEDWSARLQGKSTFIAEDDGQITGFADLTPDGHLDMFFVHKDHQGRGIAKSLMAAVLDLAGQTGISRITSDVSITARPFFEKSGFKCLAEQVVNLRGQDFTNFRMEFCPVAGRNPVPTE